ncbi:MAG: hypothetical protein E6R06_21545 [Mycobacterium sp.]|nr:MAG: hypothetical protein E6R06_21545 [Mycobacterium sp.]
MPPAKKNAKKSPAPSDPKDGANADDVVTMQFRGQTFTVPRHLDDWETDACIALSEKNFLLAVKVQLTAGNQWTRFNALGSKRRDLMEFLAIFGAAVMQEVVS